MNYTENYQLPQWVETDRVLMEDFNDAMEKVDQGMGAIPQMVSGSYVGSGTYGNGNPCQLEFPFVPKFVVIVADKKQLLVPGNIFLYGQSSSSGIGSISSSGGCLDQSIRWSGHSLSWYAGDARNQLNESGTVYRYIALA